MENDNYPNYFLIEHETSTGQKTWWNGSGFGCSELMAIRLCREIDGHKIIESDSFLYHDSGVYSISLRTETY